MKLGPKQMTKVRQILNILDKETINWQGIDRIKQMFGSFN